MVRTKHPPLKIGEKLHRLTVRKRIRLKNREGYICLCECGSSVRVAKWDLITGHSKSCGCLMRDRLSASRKKHGLRNTPTYYTHQSMIQRCFNKKHHAYPVYGGIGITVCERWRTFGNFLEDMGERPPGTTIDRFPNKTGNYEPGNCRWATKKEQSNNIKTNRLVVVNGETLTVTQACRKYNAPYKRVLQRLVKYGWSIEEALAAPAKHYHHNRRRNTALLG